MGAVAVTAVHGPRMVVDMEMAELSSFSFIFGRHVGGLDSCPVVRIALASLAPGNMPG
jgi:hypothetical protein